MTHYLWSALTTDSRLRVQQEQFAMNPHLTRFSFAYSRTFFFLHGFSTHTHTHTHFACTSSLSHAVRVVCVISSFFFATFFCYSHWEVKNLRRFNKRCSRSSTRCDRRVSALWTVLVPTVNCALGRTAHGKHGTRTVSFPPYLSRSLSARSCAA